MNKFQFFVREKKEKNNDPVSSDNIFWGLKSILFGIFIIIIFLFDKNIFYITDIDKYYIGHLIFKENSWIIYLILGLIFIKLGYNDIKKYYKYKSKNKPKK